MTFAERLKKLRKNHDLTQQKLADHLGLKRPTYAKYETGENQPDPDTLKKIADFFNVSVDYLLGRTDDPTPPGVNTVFYDLDGLTEEEKKYLYMQLEIFRKLKEELNKGKE
ncbi:transcriptional regulator [Caldalkalibacillus thermarum]|uniref:helix-turn-helix domain-containing protein n=1 Tax=Caldalkalibacillus thermarum TaxID=296745 RepID=UPI00166697E1|nr:helix-turn-helix transcriptional regulator [Caldalkalibacillus thermarum]GGK32982.1 transcriptional regulator [Caldalkalibacillus thermarum]